MSGKALAAGVAANPEPVASVIPLTYFSHGAKLASDFGETIYSRSRVCVLGYAPEETRVVYCPAR